MADDRKVTDDVSIGSQSTAGSQSSATASSTGAASASGSVVGPSGDGVDEIPVPPAMSAAEIDERAQVVEALRGDQSRVAESAERAAEGGVDVSPDAPM